MSYTAVPAVDPSTLRFRPDIEGALATNVVAPAAASVAAGKVDEGTIIFNAKKAGTGIKGDRMAVFTGAMTSGSATLTISGVSFTSGDVGKTVIVAGAGAAGATLRTTISAFISSTQVTLAVAASTTVSAKYTAWGTDDTAALQAAIDAMTTTSSNVVRGGELLIPARSRCMITDTLYIRRSGGSLRGVGFSDWASGYSALPYGSMLIWDGPSGKPMIQVEATRFFRFVHLSLIGNPLADCRPTALIRAYCPDSSTTNGQIAIENCIVGRYATYGGFAGTNAERVADTGILMDGSNSNNDRFRIIGGRVEGCTTGLSLPNSQSILGSVDGTTFFRNDTHINTAAQLHVRSAYFGNSAVRDLDISSTARVKVSDVGSEIAAQFARMRGASSLIVEGGYFQCTSSLNVDKWIIDAVDNTRQSIRLKDLQIDSATGWTVTTAPILVRAHASTDSALSNKQIELDGVRYPNSTNIGITPSFFDVTPVGSLESVTVWGHVQPAGGGNQNHGVEQSFYNILRSPSDVLNFTRDDRVGVLIAAPSTFIAMVAAAPAGSTVRFPAGIYVNPSGLGNGLTVGADNVTLEFAAGAEIQVSTWGQPGVDCVGRNGVRVIGGTVRYTGTRGNHLSNSGRASALYAMGGAVYINGNRCVVDGMRSIGMPVGVSLSSWRTSTAYDSINVGNRISNLEVENANFGILFMQEQALTIANLYVHDDIDDSSGANPTHAIYGSSTTTYRSNGLTVSNCVAENILGGQAYQAKFADNATMTGMVARNCRGLLNLIGNIDFSFTDASITGSLASLTAPNGSITVQGSGAKRVRMKNVSVIVDAAGVDQRIVLVEADDSVVDGLTVVSTRATNGAVATGVVQVRGDGNTVTNLSISETSIYPPVGLLVGGSSVSTVRTVVDGVRASNVYRVVDFYAPAGGVVRYDRALAVPTSSQWSSVQSGTPDFKVYEDDILTVTGTPEGAVTARVGSVAKRTDGASGTSLYVKQSGTGNTGWSAVPTVGGTPTDIQGFSSSGTWTKPAGARSVDVICIGAGTGGGSGRRGTSGTVCGGGGGGAAGIVVRATFDAADLGSTETVTIPTGGAGGAAVTADNTDGNNGGLPSGSTIFGTSNPKRVQAVIGASTSSGRGGTTSGGAGGISPYTLGTNSQMSGGGAGGTGAVGTAVNPALMGPAGGPGGGGISGTPAAFAGGAGSYSCMATTSGGAGGVVDTTSPTAGTAPTQVGAPGQSGGGGAASLTTAAQAGATATGYGAGGAGGGASLNGNASGAGGAGGGGYCLVITHF